MRRLLVCALLVIFFASFIEALNKKEFQALLNALAAKASPQIRSIVKICLKRSLTPEIIRAYRKLQKKDRCKFEKELVRNCTPKSRHVLIKRSIPTEIIDDLSEQVVFRIRYIAELLENARRKQKSNQQGKAKQTTLSERHFRQERNTGTSNFVPLVSVTDRKRKKKAPVSEIESLEENVASVILAMILQRE